jgi:transposase
VLSLSGRQSIFACTSPVDFRKQHDGLVALVRDQLGTDPFDGSVFVFFNKRRDRIKLLVWDGNGFWLLYKRLESGTFERLRNIDSQRLALSRAELSMLLDGIALEIGKRRRLFADEYCIDGRTSQRQETEHGRAAR